MNTLLFSSYYYYYKIILKCICWVLQLLCNFLSVRRALTTFSAESKAAAAT